MKYHLEGMGLMGSFLAHYMMTKGIKFTWSDIDSPYTAWKASTGIVIPTGDDKDYKSYQSWHEHMGNHQNQEMSPWGKSIKPFVETARWCYTSVHPPHDGHKVGVEEHKRVGGATVSNRVSIHVNVQQLVTGTQDDLEHLRADGPKKGERLIITHGFGDNLLSYGWGWSAVVKADFDDDFMSANSHLIRPALYLRKGLHLAYLMPLPNTRHYLAGTSKIIQQEPSRRDLADHYDSFVGWLADRAGEVVKTDLVRIREGWRPIPKPDIKKLVYVKNKVLRIKPQSSNGIRHFPFILEAIEKYL